MKKLLLSTALVAVMTVGATAQTVMPDTREQNIGPAFLASDITGATLYTLPSEEARALRADGMAHGDAMMPTDDSALFLAERDAWEGIGSIADIVMTPAGEVRGVLLDLGGFLGFGARTVMIDTTDLHFVRDTGDPADVSLVVTMTTEELEALPEWDSALLQAGFHAGEAAYPVRGAALGDGTGDPETMAGGSAALGDVFGPEHVLLDGIERTGERLLAADVFDAEGDSIGTVNDIVFADDGSVDGILVDVGGFLGFGTHTVKLPIDDARIGWREDDGDVRVQVAMSAEQLQDMPEYVN